jgi:hypothetical protein
MLVFETAKRAFDAFPAEGIIPREPSLRMHPVDHQMKVRVRPVLVLDEDRLVLAEAKVAEESFGDRSHLRARGGLVGAPRDHDMIGRLLDAAVVPRNHLHEVRCIVEVVVQ